VFKILSRLALLIALVPDSEKEELAKMQISRERLCNLQDRRTIWSAPVTTLFRRDCSLAAHEGEAQRFLHSMIVVQRRSDFFTRTANGFPQGDKLAS
jgi:hypothetical protein